MCSTAICLPFPCFFFIIIIFIISTLELLDSSMETAMNLVSSSSSPLFSLPPRTTHFRNSCSFSSFPFGISSTASFHVSMAHEQASTAVSSMSISAAQHSPSHVNLQEENNDSMALLHMLDEEVKLLSISQWNQINDALLAEEDDENGSDKLLRDFQHQLLHLPGLSSLFQSPLDEGRTSITSQSASTQTEELVYQSSGDAISLAMDALSAAKEAASLAESSVLMGADRDESFISSFVSFTKERTVRSTRHLERQAKKRKVSKCVTAPKIGIGTRAGSRRDSHRAFDPKNHLALFLRVPESRKLLTLKQETSLISKVQDMTKLEEAKRKLHSHLNREPTITEWAKTVGTSCGQLQSQLQSGYRSREKLIYANLLLVVHIAKQYRGSGLGFQDLLQAGSIGLMRSIDKYNPRSAARFGTYAYWWIRQSMRLAIHKNSRLIQLPVTMYDLQRKVSLAKRSYFQEGNHYPTDEHLAQRAGTTVEKLWKLQRLMRAPVSLQQPVWSDQESTFQEITADTEVESPEISVGKEMMRKHVRSLLNSLNHQQRQVIKLRFGIGYGKRHTLHEIGALFDLSVERIRQIELQAIDKLRQSLRTHGLDAYVDLLV